MENLIMDEVSQFTAYLRQFADAQPVDMANRFNLPILNALWRVTVGERFDYDDPQLNDLIQRLGDLIRRSHGPAALLMLTQPWIFRLFPPDYSAEPRDLVDKTLIEIQKTTDEGSSFYGAKGRVNLASTLVDLFQAG